MDTLKLKILELLKEDARRSAELIATMLGTAEAEVARAISHRQIRDSGKLEQSRRRKGYRPD